VLALGCWYYAAPTIEAVRLRMRKREEITASTVATVIEQGGSNDPQQRRVNIGEDNDPDLHINPVTVARMQMEEKREKDARKAKKLAAAQARNAELGTCTNAAAGSSEATTARKKPLLEILGIRLSAQKLPGLKKTVSSPSEMGLKDIDVRLKQAAERSLEEQAAAAVSATRERDTS